MKPRILDRIVYKNTIVSGEILLTIVSEDPLVLVVKVVERSEGKKCVKKIKLNYNAGVALLMLSRQAKEAIGRYEGPFTWTASVKFPNGFMEARMTRFFNGGGRARTRLKFTNHISDETKENLVLFEKGIFAIMRIGKKLEEILKSNKH